MHTDAATTWYVWKHTNGQIKQSKTCQLILPVPVLHCRLQCMWHGHVMLATQNLNIIHVLWCTASYNAVTSQQLKSHTRKSYNNNWTVFIIKAIISYLKLQGTGYIKYTCKMHTKLSAFCTVPLQCLWHDSITLISIFLLTYLLT